MPALPGGDDMGDEPASEDDTREWGRGRRRRERREEGVWAGKPRGGGVGASGAARAVGNEMECCGIPLIPS